jgi:DNA-binding SARP family transcriptional activator
VLEFRILGPLEVAADGEPLQLSGQKQRALLALLLLDANRVV